MRYVRRLIYRLGMRPRPGSIFHSPSLSMVYAWRWAMRQREKETDHAE